MTTLFINSIVVVLLIWELVVICETMCKSNKNSKKDDNDTH
jgi:hypothetical protein